MPTTKAFKNLSQAEQRAIKKYVDKLFEKKFESFKTYFDVDSGLELRPEIIKRLKKGKKGQERISHNEFWNKALEK